MIRLPAGFTAAPLTDADIDAVVALVRHCEAFDSGQALYERADLVADLALADRARDALVVRADSGSGVGFGSDVGLGASAATGPIVAWGMVAGARSRWADVHPDARGQGLGRALVDWSVGRAAELGADRIGQTVDDERRDAVALMRGTGARAGRTAWILRRDLDLAGPAPGVRSVPGMRVRDFRIEDEAEVLGLLAQAFTQGPDRPATSIEAWQAMVTRREGFLPQDLQLAVLDQGLGAGLDGSEGAGAVAGQPGGGRIVAAAFVLTDGEEAWVDKLATSVDVRGRGIGQLLMEQVFAEAHARGIPHVTLSTDSTSGALPFYERLGMRVVRSFTHWTIDVRGAGGAVDGSPKRQRPTGDAG